jgi:hypothetical protein
MESASVKVDGVELERLHGDRDDDYDQGQGKQTKQSRVQFRQIAGIF